MLKDKKILINILMTGAIVLLGYYILNKQDSIIIPAWTSKNLLILQQSYLQYPVRAILLFWLLHLISSTFSIPGSCTFLNVISGAVFGFAEGCLIVYSVTIISSCLGYLLGRNLPLSGFRVKYSKQIDVIQENLKDYEYVSMIMIRLSPFLPFGVLNLLFGFLKIPFKVYLLSTTVGVFFDVVLLNSIGSLASGHSATEWQSKKNMLGVFVFLFVAVYALKILKAKSKFLNPQTKQD